MDVRALTGALSDLCKEGGATSERTEALLSPFDLDFPLDEQDGNLVEILDWASSLIVDRQHREAIRNALGLGDEHASALNLTERRSAYLRSDTSVSPRTLIRHEREGAHALAQILATMLDEEVVILPFRAIEVVKEIDRENTEIKEKYDAVVEVASLLMRIMSMNEIYAKLGSSRAQFDAALKRGGWTSTAR